MTPEVRAKIDGYRPRTDRARNWDAIRDLVVELAVASDPPSAKNASATMSAITGLVVWAETKRIPLEAANLADYAVIDWHLNETGYIHSTHQTYRSCLDRMVKGRRSGRSGSRRPVLAPYTAKEASQLLALIDAQPTRASALRLEGMLRVGLGAGPTAAELRHLRPGDIIRHCGHVAAHLGEGDEQRTVPVLATHQARLWQVARRAETEGLGYLVTGNGNPDNSGALSKFVSDINGSAQAPQLVASRLRTTWLVTHLRARTPFDLLIPAAGPTSVARLAELLAYVDATPDDEAARLLAGAEGNAGRGGEEGGGG